MKKIDRSTMTVIRFAIPLCLSFLIVVGVVLVAVLHPSLGWFSETENLMVGGMSVVTSTDDCDLLIDRGTEYDRMKGNNAPLNAIPLYYGISMLKTHLLLTMAGLLGNNKVSSQQGLLCWPLTAG